LRGVARHGVAVTAIQGIVVGHIRTHVADSRRGGMKELRCMLLLTAVLIITLATLEIMLGLGVVVQFLSLRAVASALALVWEHSVLVAVVRPGGLVLALLVHVHAVVAVCVFCGVARGRWLESWLLGKCRTIHIHTAWQGGRGGNSLRGHGRHARGRKIDTRLAVHNSLFLHLGVDQFLEFSLADCVLDHLDSDKVL
jgi:hypothetical protein